MDPIIQSRANVERKDFFQGDKNGAVLCPDAFGFVKPCCIVALIKVLLVPPVQRSMEQVHVLLQVTKAVFCFLFIPKLPLLSLSVFFFFKIVHITCNVFTFTCDSPHPNLEQVWDQI